jgi:hypothetical protein
VTPFRAPINATPQFKRWGSALLVAAFAVVVIATVGIPPFLVLTGAWSYAALFNRWVNGLSGPVSWAGGLVVEAVFLLAESGVLAFIYPHDDPQWVYVAMLLAPIGLSLALYWRLSSVARPRDERRSPKVSAEPYLVIVCIILIAAMFEAIKLHGHDFGLTWFMGGDGRNHVIANRAILNAGGITLHEMSTYPAFFNAIAAIVDGAGGRSNITNGVLLVRDVQAMTAMVVMSCVGIALFFIAALVELFPRGDWYVQRLPLYVWIPLGSCGSIAVGAFVLSLAASGGFFSAMGCLVFALASLVLGLRIVQRYDHLTLILLTLSLALVVGSWTFLFVVPAAALIVGYVSALRHLAVQRAGGETRQMRITLVVLCSSVACLLAVVVVLAADRSTLITQMKQSGGIVGPNPRLFDWLGVVTVVAVLSAPNSKQRFARLLLLIQFAVLWFTVSRIRSLHPAGVDWSYYATKMIWLATAMLLWAPFILLLDVMRWVHAFLHKYGWRAVVNVTMSVAGSSGLLWGIGHETPFTFPLAWAWFGSTIPSPLEIELVTQQADVGGPFVIWDYSTPFQDKLGNFWSALTWDYRANGTEKAEQGPVSFVNWADVETGLPSDLCEIVSHYRLRVVTLNAQLVPSLHKTCPGYLRAGTSSAVTSAKNPQ